MFRVRERTTEPDFGKYAADSQRIVATEHDACKVLEALIFGGAYIRWGNKVCWVSL